VAGILFIISAPSGSGKSTLVNALRSQVGGIDFSISWTTRQPRGSEQTGREYHFTTREEFERMRAAGEFLEYAEVFGNYYGTARRSLEEATQRRDTICCWTSMCRARRRSGEDSRSGEHLYHAAQSKGVAHAAAQSQPRRGLCGRSRLQRRLDEAKKEIENYRQYRYILVNDVLERPSRNWKHRPGGKNEAGRQGRWISAPNGSLRSQKAAAR
jgi:guanylate kinase